ncbi:MAG: MATE family efflux transporter [Oscillospiraceae bacterium]
MTKISAYDKHFYKKALAVAIPVALQGLLNNALNVMDTIMIGKLGEESLAAVGLSNKVFFVLSLLLFGIAGGATVLTAQYWGNKDVKNVRRVLGISVSLGLTAAIIFFLAGSIMPSGVLRIFTPDQNIIALGSKYLLIVAFSYPFQAISQCYTFFYRAINKVKFTVYITGTAILINVFINYILIYGKLGFPQLGVQGAAIGTLIARAFECIAILTVVYVSKDVGAAKLKDLFNFDKAFLKKFFRIATPVIFNESMWGLGVTMYSLVYGRMGVISVATITVVSIIEETFVAAFAGLSSATGVVLGNEMGNDKLDEAKRHSKVILITNLIVTFVLAGLLILTKKYILMLFGLSPEVSRCASICLLVFALYMPFKTYNYVNIVGVLRSGGDTKYALFLDFSGVWLIGVPMAVIGGLILKQPIYIVYAMLMIEEIYKAIVGFPRYAKGKWIRNIVK